MQTARHHPLATPSRSGAPLRGVALAQAAIGRLDRLAPVVDLALRVSVATVFFQSGLAKLASWPATVSLFENVYAVPLLAPELAAVLGTAVELVFPVLLVLGLGARLSALVLFLFNIVAVLSYPELGEVGLRDHRTWGLLLLVTLLHGPGALSLDHLVRRRFARTAA